MSGPFRCFEEDFFFLKDCFWEKEMEGGREGCFSLISNSVTQSVVSEAFHCYYVKLCIYKT